jgi:hypothetical protein
MWAYRSPYEYDSDSHHNFSDPIADFERAVSLDDLAELAHGLSLQPSLCTTLQYNEPISSLKCAGIGMDAE